MDPFQNKDMSEGVLKAGGLKEGPVDVMDRSYVTGGSDVVLESLCVSKVMDEAGNRSGDAGFINEQLTSGSRIERSLGAGLANRESVSGKVISRDVREIGIV